MLEFIQVYGSWFTLELLLLLALWLRRSGGPVTARATTNTGIHREKWIRALDWGGKRL